jgi:hypothetical protein
MLKQIYALQVHNEKLHFVDGVGSIGSVISPLVSCEWSPAQGSPPPAPAQGRARLWREVARNRVEAEGFALPLGALA